MAVAIPAAAVGGAALAGGATGATALAAAGLGASLFAAHQSAQSQKAALKMQARQEGIAAADRELERRRRIVGALSSQRASAAGRGVSSTTGSAAAIGRDSLRLFQLDQAADQAATDLRQQSIRMESRAVTRNFRNQAATSLLDFGTRQAERG